MIYGYTNIYLLAQKDTHTRVHNLTESDVTTVIFHPYLVCMQIMMAHEIHYTAINMAYGQTICQDETSICN